MEPWGKTQETGVITNIYPEKHSSSRYSHIGMSAESLLFPSTTMLRACTFSTIARQAQRWCVAGGSRSMRGKSAPILNPTVTLPSFRTSVESIMPSIQLAIQHRSQQHTSLPAPPRQHRVELSPTVRAGKRAGIRGAMALQLTTVRRLLVPLMSTIALMLGTVGAVSPASAAVLSPPSVAGVGPTGTATMHGDVQSSDTSPYAGPGDQGMEATFRVKTAACPTILADSEGMIWSLCTKIFGRSPVAMLLDPDTGETLASLDIAKGALLGGVYAYLDDKDRLVLVDGKNQLLKLGKERVNGAWTIRVDERFNIAAFVNPQDAVVGLTPDAQGNIWLASRQGKVGIVRAGETNHTAPRISAVTLGKGERVDNSISSSPRGVAVATSHALYLLTPGGQDASEPVVSWRQDYDRGSARKPGQLSWGTGATPSFFGPKGTDEYLTITDNADGQISLLVYDTQTGAEVCNTPVFGSTGGGSENSSIAYGNAIYVANTHGYPYPAMPEGAGLSKPLVAPFQGGMQRIDVNADGSGCHTVWTSPVASSAVPRLSVVDNIIYTVERPNVWGMTGSAFNAVTVDADTGEVTSRHRIADTALQDTLEMVGTITKDGVWWQGAMSGVFRLEAAPGNKVPQPDAVGSGVSGSSTAPVTGS